MMKKKNKMHSETPPLPVWEPQYSVLTQRGDSVNFSDSDSAYENKLDDSQTIRILFITVLMFF